MHAHILWSASQVVDNPGHEEGIDLNHSQLVTQTSLTDGVKCTRELKQHDPHSARKFIRVSIYLVGQVDDGVLNPPSGLIGELEGVQKWLDLAGPFLVTCRIFFSHFSWEKLQCDS